MRGVDEKRLISKEIAEFIESGVAIVVGTRNGDLAPDGAAAWAARVAPDGVRVTVYLYEEAGHAALRNLRSYPEIALDIDSPITHRACQIKGLFVSSRIATEAERPLVERQIDDFGTELETIGIPRAMTEGWKTWPCLALEIRATQLFEQTPGPGTGEPLR
jgi:hypothetical protein